jgi:hypothetical protein
MKSLKNTLAIVFLLLNFVTTHAQKKEKSELIPPSCFNKMIQQDITYAIFGEVNPVNGIKIDISKPEATITGFTTLKKSKGTILSFDFKGGVTDKNFSLIKGASSFNTAIELRPSIHFMSGKNFANYNPQLKPLIIAKNQLLDTFYKIQADTFNIVGIIYNKHCNKLKKQIDKSIVINDEIKKQTKILAYFIKKLVDQKKPITDSLPFDTLFKLIPEIDTLSNGQINTKTFNEKIFNTYLKYKKGNSNSTNEKETKKISNASDAWTGKFYRWLTISPFGRTEKLNMYYTKYGEIDSSYFKQEYPFFYGLGIYFNGLAVYPNKLAHYLKFGVNLSHSSNLTCINALNYETRNPLYAYGSSVTEKTKSGTAYKVKDYQTDFMGQFSLEYYLIPTMKNLIPGLYIAPNFNYSSMYRLKDVSGREKDMYQISGEGGLVFSINSKEKGKEKNLLTIIFYTRFEDFTDKRRTANTPNSVNTKESKGDYENRNLSYGIKVGIPINLAPRK